MNKTVLITGAGGFLGNSLTRHLAKHFPSWSLTGMTRSPSEKSLCLDLNDSAKLRKFFSRSKPDVIFHLAGGHLANHSQLLQSNYSTTVSLLESIRNIPDFSPRVIIPGSAAEYGPPSSDGLIKEIDPAKPQSPYGKMKWRQTRAALQNAKKYGMDIVVVRIFNTVGEGTPIHFAPGRFAHDIVRIEHGKRPAVLETRNIDGKRDFLDIQDVCAALVAAALKGKAGEIYNVCSAKAVSLRSMARMLCRLSSVKNISIEEKQEERSESFDAVGSNRKIRKDTGWRPCIPFRQSLAATLDYYRQLSIRKGKKSNSI